MAAARPGADITMTPVAYSVVEWAVVSVASAACATDVAWRRVPNVLTLGAALAGLGLHGALDGPRGLLLSAIGWGVGLLVFLPVFALRGLGGGDVKLLAAFGAFVGPRLVIWTALYGAIAGGVFALALTLGRGVFMRTLGNLRFILTQWRLAGVAPVEGFTLDDSANVRLPYALPLACGLLVALWLQG